MWCLRYKTKSRKINKNPLVRRYSFSFLYSDWSYITVHVVTTIKSKPVGSFLAPLKQRRPLAPPRVGGLGKTRLSHLTGKSEPVFKDLPSRLTLLHNCQNVHLGFLTSFICWRQFNKAARGPARPSAVFLFSFVWREISRPNVSLQSDKWSA